MIEDLRYFKIKFDDLVENEIEYTGEKTLKNVLITDNYFSFNVEIAYKDKGAYLVKFAFFKKPVNESADYVPKQWFEKDSTLFFPVFSEKEDITERHWITVRGIMIAFYAPPVLIPKRRKSNGIFPNRLPMILKTNGCVNWDNWRWIY